MQWHRDTYRLSLSPRTMATCSCKHEASLLVTQTETVSICRPNTKATHTVALSCGPGKKQAKSYVFCPFHPNTISPATSRTAASPPHSDSTATAPSPAASPKLLPQPVRALARLCLPLCRLLPLHSSKQQINWATSFLCWVWILNWFFFSLQISKFVISILILIFYYIIQDEGYIRTSVSYFSRVSEQQGAADRSQKNNLLHP